MTLSPPQGHCRITPKFQVTVQTPALFSHDSDVVVFYKHFVGSYRRIGKISNDIVDILPRGQARLFTIYYNAREQHNSKNSSQAAVGCIYQGIVHIPINPT